MTKLFSFWLYLLLVSVLIVSAPFSALSAEPTNTTVKIGFVLPLSGDWAFLGDGIRDSAILAKEDLTGRKYTYELVFEDNRGDLKESATIAKRLIHIDKVDALVSIISGVGMLLNPMAEKAKVLNIGICSNTDVAKGEFNFVNYLTAKQGVGKFMKEIDVRYSEGSNIAVFSMNEAGFNFIVDELRQRMGDSKSSISSVEIFEPKTTDFRTQIVRAFKKKPDAVLILGLSPEIESLGKQIKELGKKIPLVSIEGFGLAEDKQVFEGQWFVDAAVPNRDFRERFRSRYGRDVTAGCGHSYDSVMMIANAFEEAGNGVVKPGPYQVARSFQSLRDYSGALGEVKISKEGIVGTEPSIKVIREGQPQLAS